MQEQDWRLLESLAPGVGARGRDERYWLDRSAEVIALSTQDRGNFFAVPISLARAGTSQASPERYR